MRVDISAIQECLVGDHVDGWLLYDFHGSNPIAVSLAGLAGSHTTRRWYYFIPSSGEPQKIVHAIESHVLDAMPGTTRRYAGRHELEKALTEVLAGVSVVAMEYSPDCAIPYLSRVDAGTVDFIRSLGPAVVSSGDLVGRFEAAWDAKAIATHRRAAEKLYAIKDRTFAFAAARLAAGDVMHEIALQDVMMEWFLEEGLVTDHPPIVAIQEHSGNPHYAPSELHSRALRMNEVLVLDLWGKLDEPGAVYADITWTGFTGTPPEMVRRVFDAALAGRDAAIALVERRVVAGEPVHGWEVDRAARDVITTAGFGDRFIHRTGHSLGEEVHGNGVHMDDYETHDNRRLLVGTGFTIEPGIYLPTFGVRTEVNMVVGPTSAEVTGPCQRELVRLA